MTGNKIINNARKYIGMAYSKLLTSLSNNKSQRIRNRTLNTIEEFVALVLGAIVICLFSLSIILTHQSVDISIFKPVAEKALTKSFSGLDVKIGKINIKWIASTNNLRVELDDVFASDKSGKSIELVSHMSTEFPLASLLGGSLIPENIDIEGGSVTITRTRNENIQLSLGTSLPAKEFGPSWKIYSPENKNKSKFRNFIANVQISNADVLVLDNKDKLELRLIDSNTILIFQMRVQSLKFLVK